MDYSSFGGGAGGSGGDSGALSSSAQSTINFPSAADISNSPLLIIAVLGAGVVAVIGLVLLLKK